MAYLTLRGLAVSRLLMDLEPTPRVGASARKMPGFWLGIIYGGLGGVLLAWLGVVVIALVINVWMIRQHIGTGPAELFSGAWRTPVAVLGMTDSEEPKAVAKEAKAMLQ